MFWLSCNGDKKHMILVNIIGGLGNQMFQYAFGYALVKQNGETLKLDTSDFINYPLRGFGLDCFNLEVNIASKGDVKKYKYRDGSFISDAIRRICNNPKRFSNHYFKEKSIFHETNDFQNKKYFVGYWQNEKYFYQYRDEILNLFSLKKKIQPKTLQYELLIKDTESVSLHIRRGDYVSNEHTNSVHGVCSLGYYGDAITYIKGKVNEPHFYIFSDDLIWAKKNLAFVQKKTFIELNKPILDYEEIYLMSRCKHNIIANSSFSWWGAWLNDHCNKLVIAPQKWFVDETRDTSSLVPDSWVRL